MRSLSKLALALLLITATIACKNNTTTEADAETATNTNAQKITETHELTKTTAGFASMTFKMDGTLIEATGPGVMVIYVPTKKEVNIRGNTSKGLFAIIIDKVEGPGTFTIQGNSKSGAGLMMQAQMYEVKKTGTPFTVTIDAVEDIAAYATPDAKAIRGTFEGKIMDKDDNTITISEGKFSSQ
ncbi:MAG: hypothetical protein ABIO60_11830 [Aquaticitalea sp.]